MAPSHLFLVSTKQISPSSPKAHHTVPHMPPYKPPLLGVYHTIAVISAKSLGLISNSDHKSEAACIPCLMTLSLHHSSLVLQSSPFLPPPLWSNLPLSPSIRILMIVSVVHTDNPGLSPHLKILDLTTPAKYALWCKVTFTGLGK